jgi:hypothetical protein
MNEPPAEVQRVLDKITLQLMHDPDKSVAHQSDTFCLMFEEHFDGKYYLLPIPAGKGVFRFRALDMPKFKIQIPGFTK